MKRLQLGFTLVELLVVFALTGVIGAVVLGIISSTFKVANKADVLSSVQQNGNAALSQIVKTIRFASAIEDPPACYSGTIVDTSITLRNQSNKLITFTCDTDAGTLTSAEGTAVENLLNPDLITLTNCSFTCSQASRYSAPVIKVSFSIKKNDNTEDNEPKLFTSSVSIRQ